MDGLGLLLGFLAVLCFAIILWLNYRGAGGASEGFEDRAATATGAAATASQVQTVMDRQATPHAAALCSLFNTIRTTGLKNAKAGTNISDEEAAKRVEKDLALKIPGGALPCSGGTLLTYPKATATDLEWLDWLQKIPDDFGARVVFMALYAKESLGKTAQDMKDALGGNAVPPAPEGFTTAVCPPDVAATRRAEAAGAASAACVLPEDMTPEEIKEAITERLKLLVATREKALKAKSIENSIDISPLIANAKVSAAYLEKSAQQAESGTLPIGAAA